MQLDWFNTSTQVMRVPQTTELNHYVPRGYLARWSHDGGKTIWEHKIIVPHERYPLWKQTSLRSAGARRNLYDAHLPGFGRDHFEKWLKDEVEEPAYSAIAHLEAGESISSEHWVALVRFAVAQDLRTPKGQQVHEVLETHAFRTFMEEMSRLVDTFDPDAPAQPQRDAVSPLDEQPLIDTTVTPVGDGLQVEVSLRAGSTSWMQRNKRMVREFTSEAANHFWQIIQPHPPQTWPTCDHPLVRFERREAFNIHGTGWLRNGTEIFLPLTPRFALYSKVGEIRPRDPIASRIETWEFVRLLIGHADRSMFADRQGYKWIEWHSPRHVDMESYNSVRP